MTLRYANVSDVPLALAVFLATDSYQYNSDPNTVSATTLLKPIRQIVLPPRIPPGEGLTNLSDMMASRIGTAIHNGIENAWLNNYRLAMAAIGLPQSVIDRIRINPKLADMPEDAIPIYLEQRLSRQLGKWTVTGAFDFVSEGRVQDFKSTSVWAYQKQVNTEKFAKQGSIYRWLGSNIITADELDIHWIFTDWKGAMFKSDTAYPPRRFLTQKIPLLTLGDTEHLITTKLALVSIAQLLLYVVKRIL